MKLLVTLGYHSIQGKETFNFKEGGVLLIDWDTKRILKELNYVSPPENSAVPGRMLFHSGELNGSSLVVTSSSEVVFINVDEWRVEKVITHRWFNDLHHAIVRNGYLYVCNTGLQCVHQLTLDGEMMETWSVDNKDTWSVFDKETDYRTIDIKPHIIHPNHLFMVGDDLWVTRCKYQDTVQVLDHSNRMYIGDGRPHDGVEYGGLTYFTMIQGFLTGLDIPNRKTVKHIDLNQADPGRGQLGWCRGIRHISEDCAFVAFSQFRQSKHKDFIHWILKDGKNRLPSRIVQYDLNGPKVIDEMSFTGKLEGAAIYSIFVVE